MGGPPGYPPVQPKKGAPVALLVGGGCGLFAVLGVIALAIVLLAGSGGSDSSRSSSSSDDDDSSSDDSSSSDDETAPENEGDVMVGATFKRIPSTNVEVPVPPGWREDRRSLYSFALSNDGDALLAFTTVSSVGEFAGRLQHAERVFRITDCNMQPATRVRIGPNSLRSRLVEGECTFNGVRASVATVLVETGRRALPLVIYAVDKRASSRTSKQAQQTIARMRLR